MPASSLAACEGACNAQMPFGKSRSGARLRKPCAFLTGKERDPESANDYFGARYYWNGAARWLGADPIKGSIKNPQRLNGYSHALNDPVNYLDPDGRDPEPIRCYECDEETTVTAEAPSVSQFDPGIHFSLYNVAPPGPPPQARPGSGWTPPGPPPDALENAERAATVRTATATVRTILEGDNPCANFFGGAFFAKSLFKLLTDRTGIAGVQDRVTGGNSTTIGISTTLASTTPIRWPNEGNDFYFYMPTSMIVNANGPFFSGAGNFGSYQGNTLAGQVLALLHELAHLVATGPNGPPLIPFDGDNPQQSISNTATVEGACEQQLEAINSWK